MNANELYSQLDRDPADFPLFKCVWEAIDVIPVGWVEATVDRSGLVVDAFDYVRTDGHWEISSPLGKTILHLNNNELHLESDNGRGRRYERTFRVASPE